MNTIDKFCNSGNIKKWKWTICRQTMLRVAAAVEAVSAAAASASAATSAIKVNKAGDVMTGDLDIRLSENNLRTFGVSDANSHGKTVSLLLGNVKNQIKYSFDTLLKIIASNVTSINCLGDNGVWRPVCVFSDTMSEFNGDVSLNNHKISLLSDPLSDSDAVNKSYLLNKINSV